MSAPYAEGNFPPTVPYTPPAGTGLDATQLLQKILQVLQDIRDAVAFDETKQVIDLAAVFQAGPNVTVVNGVTYATVPVAGPWNAFINRFEVGNTVNMVFGSAVGSVNPDYFFNTVNNPERYPHPKVKDVRMVTLYCAAPAGLKGKIDLALMHP